MRFWKKPEWWWHDREWHWHSDFLLNDGEQVEIRVNGQIVLRKRVPNDVHWKAHCGMSFQPFKNGKGGER